LVHDLRRRGVRIEEGVAVRALARTAGGWTVQADDGALEADRVVVAAGVWSRSLLAPLGIDLPLEGAKGYSVTAPVPEPAPRRPLYLTEAKVGVSPFDGGRVRLAGTLELA